MKITAKQLRTLVENEVKAMMELPEDEMGGAEHMGAAEMEHGMEPEMGEPMEGWHDMSDEEKRAEVADRLRDMAKELDEDEDYMPSEAFVAALMEEFEEMEEEEAEEGEEGEEEDDEEEEEDDEEGDDDEDDDEDDDSF